MTYKSKDYLSTAEAARDLGLSVGTIQKLVTFGELDALRTQGGHRRIFIHSIEKYRAKYGYKAQPESPSKAICIMHHGQDLDPLLVQAHEAKMLKILSHPLDLLGMKQDSYILFIDANNAWVKNVTLTQIEELQRTHIIFIYNSKQLEKNSFLYDIDSVHLIPHAITYPFISGYLMGQEMYSTHLAVS